MSRLRWMQVMTITIRVEGAQPEEIVRGLLAARTCSTRGTLDDRQVDCSLHKVRCCNTSLDGCRSPRRRRMRVDLGKQWANAQRAMLNSLTTSDLSELEDEALLDIVQRQTARYFWEGAHPVSGLARDRQKTTGDPDNDLVAIGGSGFGIMAIIVAVNRGWIDRAAALGRLQGMLDFLERGPRYHGMFPHFTNGRTDEIIPFRRKDDGADLVETTFLFQGLICGLLHHLMNTTDDVFVRALGMSPAALAEHAEAAARRLAPLQATALGQPQPVFHFILGSSSGRRPIRSQTRTSPL